METKRDIEKKARSLIDSSPDEALTLYRKIRDEFSEKFNNWDAIYTLKAMRKSSNPDMDWAIEIAEKFEDEKPRGLYCWLFFDNYIKNKNRNEIIQAKEKISKLLDLVPQKNLREDDSFPCPLSITVFNLVDAYAENLFNSRKINEWLDRLTPDFLSKNPRTINTNERGDVEIASDLEKYYALKTKALLKLGQYEKCKNLCKAGLEEISNFHYNNDLWFKMRIAISEEKLGNTSESEKIFRSLLFTKAGSDKWFLYKDIAELYFEQQNYMKAWKYAVDSSFYGNEPHYMIGLYLLQARILFKLKRPGDGKVLAQLIYATIKEQGWQKKPEYNRIFKYFGLSVENIDKSEIYLKEARKFWANERYGECPVQEGIIISIHRNGKVGRIKNTYGDIIGFHKKDLIKKQRRLEKLKGDKVEFVVMEAFDGSEVAENINIVNKTEKLETSNWEGKILKGKIKNVVDFGIFVRFDGHPDGLLHRNSFPGKLKNTFKEAFQIGDNINVVVVKVTEKGIQLKLTNE